MRTAFNGKTALRAVAVYFVIFTLAFGGLLRYSASYPLVHSSDTFPDGTLLEICALELPPYDTDAQCYRFTLRGEALTQDQALMISYASPYRVYENGVLADAYAKSDGIITRHIIPISEAASGGSIDSPGKRRPQPRNGSAGAGRFGRDPVPLRHALGAQAQRTVPAVPRFRGDGHVLLFFFSV